MATQAGMKQRRMLVQYHADSQFDGLYRATMASSACWNSRRRAVFRTLFLPPGCTLVAGAFRVLLTVT